MSYNEPTSRYEAWATVLGILIFTGGPILLVVVWLLQYGWELLRLHFGF